MQGREGRDVNACEEWEVDEEKGVWHGYLREGKKRETTQIRRGKEE